MPNKTSFNPQTILGRFQKEAQKLILREIAVRCDRRVVRLDDLCMTCQLAIIRVTMMLIRDGLPVKACIQTALRNAKLQPHIGTLYHPRDSQRYEQLRQSRAAKIQRDFKRQLALCSSYIGDSIHVAHGRLSPKTVVRCSAAEADCLSVHGEQKSPEHPYLRR